ncbi:hypothetical protein [Amycolatopsis sp. NPDC051372]|uniref:hypothetical protein n=1 Tax=Amycolatopsis sp. NPDC051372 TaxID=3155669 RepID=UPI003430CEA7
MTRKHSARRYGQHSLSVAGRVDFYRLYQRECGQLFSTAGLFGVLRAVWRAA